MEKPWAKNTAIAALSISQLLLSFSLSIGKAYTDPVTGTEFVLVKGGCFQMGDTFNEGDDEKPVHKVCLNDFYLAKYEVTQGQWKKIMGNNPSRFKKGDNYRVEQVSWNDAREFIRKLNAKSTGVKYSLPSEAQWEYAARKGGKKIPFATGKNGIDPAEANFCGREEFKESYSRAGEYREATVPVDSFSPNALGFYNMSGNVWEWCQDKWHTTYEGAPTDGSAWETGGDDSYRVIRGGSWNIFPRWLRAAYRGRVRAGDRLDLGFRLSFTPQP